MALEVSIELHCGGGQQRVGNIGAVSFARQFEYVQRILRDSTAYIANRRIQRVLVSNEESFAFS